MPLYDEESGKREARRSDRRDLPVPVGPRMMSRGFVGGFNDAAEDGVGEVDIAATLRAETWDL